MTPNMRAFAQVVRACEGTSGPDGYRTLFGGGLFTGWDDHPRIVVEASGYKSSAAGAYQILASTWDDFIKARGSHKFDEAGQDACYEWLVDRRGARADIEAGNLEAAIEKCNKEWSSLPGSPYGQPQRSLAFCRAVWSRALPKEAAQVESASATDLDSHAVPASGGVPPAAAQLGEVSMGPAVFLPAILQMVPQLVGMFSKDKDSAKNVKIAETVVQAFTAAVPGAVNAQDAVEKAQADEQVRSVAAAAVLANPTVELMMQIGPTGMQDARAANLALMQSADKWWKVFVNPVLIVSAMVLPMVYLIVIELIRYMDKVSADVIAQTVGTIVGLVLGGVMGFWMGQTYNQTSNRRATDNAAH